MDDAKDLYHDADLASFYDLENGWAADFEFCSKLTKGAKTVLDLGCGTGELACHLGKTKSVTAVDPANAMLDIGRNRPGGDRVKWVLEDATKFKSDKRFDLIILTSNSFQVFLTEQTQLAVLKTIAMHLTPDGRFIFGSRNPTAKAWENWTPQKTERKLEHPEFGETRATTDASYDEQTGIVSYETLYQTTSNTFHARSDIKFTSQPELSALLDRAGLKVLKWFGDWEKNPFDAKSKDIVPLGGLSAG